MKKYKVGIIGATGMVGQRFVLLTAKHPWFEPVVLRCQRPQRRQGMQRTPLRANGSCRRTFRKPKAS